MEGNDSADEENENQAFNEYGTSKSQTLFMPLTGKEDALRLEDKYGLLHSEEEEDDDELPLVKRGKVSQWELEEGPSKWLATQSNRTFQKVAFSPSKRNSPRKMKIKNISRSRDQVPTVKSLNKSRDQNPGPSDTLEDPLKNNECLRKRSPDLNISSSAHNEDNFGNEGFSLEDTERPKLHIQPVAVKVAFQLSEDNVQPPVLVPASINQYLRDYQRAGIKFLYSHYVQKKGCILGDDMGLGKTIQVIGFLAALLGKQGNHRDSIHALPKFIRELSDDISDSPPRTATKPFLIIGPSAVMFNWLDELQTWGYFTAGKFHGGDKDSCLSDVRKGKLEIIVTTFETFRDNADKLGSIEWEAVIVDEVHKIKGLKAQITKALGLINTPCRYGLTGTALQNNMIELFAILNWALPGILGSPERFHAEYVHAIELGQKHDATKRALANARKQKEKFSQIREKVMLRRTKALLGDQLPNKEDLVVMCRLTDLQVSVYKAVLSHPDMFLVLQAEDPCDCGREKARASCCYRKAKDGTKTWSLILSYMHLLLKAANHCALLIPESHSAETVQFKRASEVCDLAFQHHPEFLEQTKTAAFMTLSDPKYCGKMKILQGLLNLFAAAHDKVLIFSYSTKLLDIIEHYVMSKCHTFRRIDGKTSSQKRIDIVHQFNCDPDIFLCLISTKAGGLGLNLTGANRVIIFDPNWNPSHDLQAQDRAFRIGQSRNVKVYRLVSAGTIEENIYLRQLYKQQLDEVAVSNRNAKRLFHGIQGDKKNRGELFGVRNMFSLRTGNTCLTMDILKRNDRLEKGMENYDITRYIPSKSDDDNAPIIEENESKEEDTQEKESEEDDNLLESIFGMGMLHQKDKKKETPISPMPGHSRWPDLGLESPDQPKNVSNKTHESDSDDDDEFSLIPTLYPKSKRENPSPSYHEKDKGDFTIEDITFPKSVFNTAMDTAKSSVKPRTGSAGLSLAAISLIFSDSDSSDDKAVSDGAGKKKRPSEIMETAAKKTVNKSSGDNSAQRGSVKKVTPAKASKRKHDQRGQQNKGGDKNTLPDGSLRDSVNAVFEACGVVHTHKNPDVVGSSRAEDHMSHCAIKEVFELRKNSQDPALQCDPLPVESVKEKATKKKSAKKKTRDHNTAHSVKSGSTKILLGQTPPGVQRQQWSELCKLNKSDPLALAERLVACTPEERLETLRTFYAHLYGNLRDVLSSILQIDGNDSTGDNAKQQDDKKPASKSLTKSQSSCDTERNSKTRKQMPMDGDDNDDHRGRTPRHKKETRKAKKKKRPLSPYWLAESTCLSLESQESLTAMSPPIEPPSSEDYDPQGFSPVPSSKGKKRPAAKLKSPAPKSKPMTRLRHRSSASETVKRNLLRENILGRGLHFSESDEDGDDKRAADGVSSMQTDKEMQEVVEDVPTLLTEMAMGESYSRHQNKHRKHATNKKKTNSFSRYEKQGLTSSMDTSPEMTSNSHFLSTENINNCTDFDKNRNENVQKSKTKTREVSPQKRQNYASLLDDIFSSSGSNERERPDSRAPKRVPVLLSEKSTFAQTHSKKENPSVHIKATHSSTSPHKVLPWDGDTSDYDAPPGIETSSEGGRENKSNQEDGESLSIFDSLFKMNTLKEDADQERSTKSKPGFRKNRNTKFHHRDRDNKEEISNSNDNDSDENNMALNDGSQSLFS